MIYAYDGNDQASGGAGDDVLNMGDGTDTVIFSGNLSDYEVTLNGDGSLTVRDMREGSPDGTDTLWSAEFLRFNGTDYTAADALNQAPVAQRDSYTTDEDAELTGNVLVNDTDANGDPLTVTLVDDVSNGTLTLNADGSFSYTPDADYNGTDSFTYVANDGTVDGNTVGLTVNAVNDAPVITQDPVTDPTYIENATALKLLEGANVVDVDATNFAGGSLTVTVSGSDNSLSLPNADGFQGYGPGAYFYNGTQIATYSGTASTITLTNFTAAMTPAVMQLLLDNFTYSATGNNPSGADRIVTFTLNDGGNSGTGGAQSGVITQTVHVTPVNDAPAGADKLNVAIVEDSVYTFATSDFGFSDTDGGSLHQVVITTLPTDGTLYLNSVAVIAGDAIDVADIIAGLLTFEPGADEYGDDYASMTFQVRDDGGTANGGQDTDQTANTITFDVAGVNDAPVNSLGGTIGINEDAVDAWLSGMSIADVDAGNSEVTVTLQVASGTIEIRTDVAGGIEASDVITGLAPNGEVSQNGTGTIVIIATLSQINATLAGSGGVLYTPDAQFNGDDTLTVTTDDGFASDVDTRTITVNSVNDEPAGGDDTITMDEDGTYIFAAADFGFSDTIDSNAFAGVVLTTLPASGDFYLDGVAITLGGTFVSATDIAANLLTYEPDTDGNGVSYATFTFQVRDDGGTDNGGQDTDQSPNTMTIDVTPVNEAATAQDDAFTTDEAMAIVGGDLFADNGSGADSDPDDPLVVAEVNDSAVSVGTEITLPSGALLTVNADGTFDYDPNGAFDSTPSLGSGASNTPDSDSFTYTLEGGGTATATISIDGLDSDDLLIGTAGDDWLNGGIGADQMVGGAGDDTYIVDSADSVVEAAGEGFDRVWTRSSFTLGAGESVEWLAAGGSQAVDLTGNEFEQRIYGNGNDNVLSGGGGNDYLVGRDGDDVLDGGTGDDRMLGGLGNDTFHVDSAGDIPVELAAEGSDTVVTSVDFRLRAGTSIERLETSDAAGTDPLALTGNELAQTIEGNAGDNYLSGRDGDDILIGNAGNDRLVGGGGADELRGGTGDDRYFVDSLDSIVELADEGYDVVIASDDFVLGAGVSVERMVASGSSALDLTGNELDQFIYGNGADNVLGGGDGRDYLVGNGGNDTIIGGAGVDVLRGEAGSDTFVFDDLGSHDRIGDFEVGTDTIALDSDVFTALALGTLSADAFREGASAQDGDDRIIYDSATGRVWFDPDGDGAQSATLFLYVTAGTALTNVDFMVAG